jgi:hypothetical protein
MLFPRNWLVSVGIGLDDALNVGWSRSHISKLDYVMWRESRCLPNAFNSKDPTAALRV